MFSSKPPRERSLAEGERPLKRLVITHNTFFTLCLCVVLLAAAAVMFSVARMIWTLPQ